MQRSSTIPPLSLSSSTHQLLAVHAIEDGLVLHPHSANHNKSAASGGGYVGSAVVVEWGKEGRVREIGEWKENGSEGGLVVKGIAGLLKVHEDSYLILIIETSLSATLFSPSKRIHTISSLLAIPLNELSAKSLINKALIQQKQKASSSGIPSLKRGNSVSSTASLGGFSTEDDSDDDETEGEGTETEGEGDGNTDIEADNDPHPLLIHAEDEDKKGTVKASARGGFWKRKPNYEPQQPSPLRSLAGFGGMSAPKSASKVDAIPIATKNDALPALSSPIQPIATPAASAPIASTTNATAASLLDLDQKIVKETLRELTGLYFSYTFDITHSLQHKYEIMQKDGKEAPQDVLGEPNIHLPIWRRVDKRFWWNRHLVEDFVRAGLHPYILTLQQGFTEHLSLSLPPSAPSPLSPLTSDDPPISLEIIIISRRSIERPGLRYQRRGINGDGQVANFVETEFVVGCKREGVLHVGSFVQTRGSIPIYWSQAPWALKPPPVLELTPTESQKAMKLHFEKQLELYGKQIIVNLAENTGKESAVVGAYREGVKELGMESVKYTEWDFHKECRGMKYENISKLIKMLETDLDDQRCFWATSAQVFSTQTSVVRTNCIDCLDRTNVVQSAISRWVLNGHLVRLGISVEKVGNGTGEPDGLDYAFMNAWADNGDAISREYSGTSALKGDFTRTGKRNWRGAVNDASNSVARLLQSTVTDFFKQAVIDYILGKNPSAFTEFQQRLDTSDPGELLRLAQIRREAIETAAASVISEGEEKLDGWTLLSPAEQDVVKGKFEEKILLLSNKAVYVVSYEYTLQKVVNFTRIPTGDIVGLQKGAYILSAPLDATSSSSHENYGLLLKYHSTSTIERTNTYSLRTTKLRRRGSAKSLATSVSSLDSSSPPADTHYFAFKAMRPEMIRLASDGQSQILDMRKEGTKGKTARDVVEGIIGQLREECEKVGAVEISDRDWVQEKDIISLAEAKSQVGLIDKLSHSLKELIWL